MQNEGEPGTEIAEQELFRRFLDQARELKLEWEDELYFEKEDKENNKTKTIDVDFTQRMTPFKYEEIQPVLETLNQLKEQFGWNAIIKLPDQI